ncbi:MAG TPA: AP2 domain-containing protein [Rubricoccaceae bacterium]|nr:AP2 domain-containing protein [Rubricoccaceae bacterium]
MAEQHHITRIDIEPSEAFPKRHPTHGWQVRIRRDGRRLSKFFADARHDGSDGALAAAIDYRDGLLKELPPPASKPRKAWSNTGVVGLAVREKGEGGEPKRYVLVNWTDAEGQRHGASFAVDKWGLRKALWNACLKLYRERQAAGAPVEEPHEMFARAQEPFQEEIRAEQEAEARQRRLAEAEAKAQTPEEQLKREAAELQRLESTLFKGLGF